MWDARRTARLYGDHVEREPHSPSREGTQPINTLACGIEICFADVIRDQINATTQPSKGSIIFDFGGPGNINVDSFAGSNGEALLL